jgi:hypothetical protein
MSRRIVVDAACAIAVRDSLYRLRYISCAVRLHEVVLGLHGAHASPKIQMHLRVKKKNPRIKIDQNTSRQAPERVTT